MSNICNFKNGDTVLFRAVEVDGSPAFTYDKEPVQVNETELNLNIQIENDVIYFIDTDTKEKYTFEDLTKYKDDFIFEIVK